MKFQKLLFIFIFSCMLMIPKMHGQDISGYVSGMPSVIYQQSMSDVWWQMPIHNRLNFNLQMGKYFRLDAGMRNRFILGSESMINPQGISQGAGWMDLSWNWMEWKNGVGNSSFDRLFLTFEKEKWRLQLGRQRINWGQTFVWNPNDIFNTYSFFDFDYPERPGCDAFRTTYYHNATSSSELAVSINHESKVTAALMHHWNWKNIDFQVIAGEMSETDMVVGGALTNDIKGVNLRSEFSYFHPIEHPTDTSGIVAVSLGLDYVFPNSLMLQTEALYTNRDEASSGNGLLGLYSAPLSAKNLSFSDWSLFAQVSYPITPRLNGALSGIYFVDIQACYAGITLDYSVVENLDFSFIAQYFASFEKSNPENMHVLLGFARLKYSF